MLLWLLKVMKIKMVFESVVAVAFQSIFYSKMHQNNVFLFLKNYFWHQHIKMIYIYIYIFVNFKQKKLKFLENTVLTVFPNTTKMYSSRASQMIIFVKFLTIPTIYIIIKSLIIVGMLNQTIDFYGSIRKIYVLVI